jgi:hypothetical protein
MVVQYIHFNVRIETNYSHQCLVGLVREKHGLVISRPKYEGFVDRTIVATKQSVRKKIVDLTPALTQLQQ